MKRNFLTGLMILLPLAVTVFVLIFIVNFLTKPFLESVKSLFLNLGFSHGHLPLLFLCKALILVGLACATFLIGVVGQLFFMRALIRFTERIVARIPLVNRIYNAAREAVRSLLVTEERKFSQVVLVPFPTNLSRSIAFVTNECVPVKKDNREFIPVFLPGTPNPANGFLLSFPADQVIFLEMSIEEAIKGVISCGVTLKDISAKKAGDEGTA